MLQVKTETTTAYALKNKLYCADCNVAMNQHDKFIPLVEITQSYRCPVCNFTIDKETIEELILASIQKDLFSLIHIDRLSKNAKTLYDKDSKLIEHSVIYKQLVFESKYVDQKIQNILWNCRVNNKSFVETEIFELFEKSKSIEKQIKKLEGLINFELSKETIKNKLIDKIYNIPHGKKKNFIRTYVQKASLSPNVHELLIQYDSNNYRLTKLQ